MNVNVIVKIKSSYLAWFNIFDNDGENRAKICDDSKTLCGQVDDKTALINFYAVMGHYTDHIQNSNPVFLSFSLKNKG